MARRSLHTVTVLALATIAATLLTPSLARSQSIFEMTGFQPGREYMSLEPWEHIDTMSGNLILSFTDLVLPGNAGRDLRFQRTFNEKTRMWSSASVESCSGSKTLGGQSRSAAIPV